MTWPRLRDLPEEERATFVAWLDDKPRPSLDGVSPDQQDAYYFWDYLSWRDVPSGHRLTSYLKLPVDDSTIDAAMISLGAECLDKVHIRRASGIRLADYKLGGHIIELKTLQNEPLDALNRQQKLEEFVRRHGLEGPMEMSAGQHQEYWTRIAGAPIQRAIDDAVEQIESTKTFLKDPSFLGGVLIVNKGASTIDADNLANLAKHYSGRHRGSLNLIMTLNLIPAIVDGYEKPVLTFYWDVFSLESRPVAEKVQRQFTPN